METDEILRACARLARGPLYLVGGAVRDRLLGRTTFDLDLVHAGPVGELAQALAKKLGGTPVLLDDAFQIHRVVLRDGPQVDLAAIQGGSIEADLGRRDFTVNAIAQEVPASPGRALGPLIDPFGGAADLKAKKLRAVSEKAFEDDPLRLLRAYRVAAEAGLKIEPRTAAWIKKHKNKVSKPAAERVRYELMRLLAIPGAWAWLERTDKDRLLTGIFPELEPSRKCAHVYYGKEGVLGHSLKVVERLELLLADLKKLYPDVTAELEAYMSGHRSPALLKLAALLHDVAKPRTARKRQGRLRFFGHEEKGGTMADKIMERLRFSQAERTTVASMIRHHLRPGNMAANPNVTDRAAFRYFEELGEDGIALLLMCWGDYASYLTPAGLKKILPRKDDHPNGARYDGIPKSLHKTLRHLQVVGWLLRLKLLEPHKVSPPKIIDGHDIMKALDLPPGPEIGAILDKVREAQAEGKLHTKDEALAFITKLPIKKTT